MLIEYNPDDYETIVKHRICNYHKEHPGANYAGCTCSCSVSQCRKDSNGPHGEPIPKIEICSECGTALGCEE